MSSPRSNASGFDEVDKHEDRQYFINYLDSVRSQETIRAAKERSISLLNLKPGDTALDVGCGTGEDVLSLAKIVGEKGRAVGIDNSEAMISEARKRSVKLNMANAEFVLGSAYSINYPDETFNGCRAERVFVHLEDPNKALNEIIRATKKGIGRIVISDADWDTLTLDSEFKDITRRILRIYPDGVKNGWSGRKLYGMFKDAGLVNVSVMTMAPVFTDSNDVFVRLINLDRVSKVAVEKGLISDEERKDWTADLQKKQERGQFFMSITSFMVVGTRPAQGKAQVQVA